MAVTSATNTSHSGQDCPAIRLRLSVPTAQVDACTSALKGTINDIRQADKIAVKTLSARLPAAPEATQKTTDRSLLIWILSVDRQHEVLLKSLLWGRLVMRACNTRFPTDERQASQEMLGQIRPVICQNRPEVNFAVNERDN